MCSIIHSICSIVKGIVIYICKDMEAVHSGCVASRGEPLRWSMHGGPGTGKARAITTIKGELL